MTSGVTFSDATAGQEAMWRVKPIREWENRSETDLKSATKDDAMLLYRARSLNERKWRFSAAEIQNGECNEPHVRVRGRWFTSVQADAIAYGRSSFAHDSWELVSIDVADDIVDSFRVETMPVTVDGLSPIDFADKPETEYVVQTFRVMAATRIAMPVSARPTFRVRDYIRTDAPVDAALTRSADDLGVPYQDLVALTADLPLAA